MAKSLEAKKVQTDEELYAMIKADLDAAQSLQDELAEQRAQYYKEYRCEPYGNEQEGWSKSVAPVIYNNLHGTMPQLMEIFDEDFFVLRGDSDDRAKKLQKLLYVQMFHKQDGFRRIHDFLYNTQLYHYAVLKVYKKEEYEFKDLEFKSLTDQQFQMISSHPDIKVSDYSENAYYDPMTMRPAYRYEDVKAKQRNIVFAGPWFEVVPNWEFGFSKDCKITEFGAIEGRLVYHEVTRDLDYIKKKEKAGVYRKGSYQKLKDKAGAEEPVYEKTDLSVVTVEIDEIQTDGDAPPEESKPAQKLKIYECYYKVDLDGDGILEPAIVHLCDDVILQVEANPYNRPPFRVASISPEPHKVIGIAAPSILSNDQKVMTNLLRLIQDSAAVATYRNPVTNDMQMYTNLQVRKPFSVIYGNPEKLGEIKSGDPTGYILKAYEFLKAENEEKTGLSRYNQGLDADSLNKTATGVSIISSNSARRLRLTAKLIGKGALRGLIKDFIFINQKFPVPQEQLRVLGSQLQIAKDDLYGDYDVEIDIGVGPAEKQAAANQMDLMLQWQTGTGIPLGIVTPIHVIRTVKRKYKLMNVNVDELVMTEEEFQAAQKAKQQQPPQKPPLKEIVDIDKLIPLLTKSERAQVLQQIGIQADPNAIVTGLPDANTMLKAQQEAKGQKFDIISKLMDMKEAKKDRQHEMTSQLVDIHNQERDRQSNLAKAHLDIRKAEASAERKAIFGRESAKSGS